MSPTAQAFQAEQLAAKAAQQVADANDHLERGKAYQWTALHDCERAAKASAIFPETYRQTALLLHVQNPVSGSWSVLIGFTAKSRLGLDVPARMACTIDAEGNFKSALAS